MPVLKVTDWGCYKYGKNLPDGVRFECEVVPYQDMSGDIKEMALVPISLMIYIGADMSMLGEKDAIFKVGIGCHIE